MKPLIGCASHRFALVVQDYVEGNQSVINKIHQLMDNLRGMTLSAKLRQHTNLRPVLFVSMQQGGRLSLRVGGHRSKERDQKSELVLMSTYQIFE